VVCGNAIGVIGFASSSRGWPCRRRWLAHAAVTIVLGLVVHWWGTWLPDRVRDFTGDALWAAMMLFAVGALLPRRPARTRALVALSICYVVEWSQRLHAPWLDMLRATRGGHLILGSGFDARDLVAYAVGAAVALVYAQRFIWACDDSMP
jgi:hypothetical protein